MRKEPRSIELLSPAKDLICGREAINHGADAVYIGAPKFGARAAAGNTLDDIRQLCDYAHLYSARIYVALNTILKEEELAEAANDLATLRGRGGCLDRSRHGYHPVEPSAHPLARQYANG